MSRHAADWTWRRHCNDKQHDPNSDLYDPHAPRSWGMHRENQSSTHQKTYEFRQRTTS